ncbi:MAG: DMT family transporter [Lachnospiraceae bacterium]|nr:DMT family transporter [Lachnospiraceae bacterium]
MSEKNKGILYILCAAFCFALMNLFVKAAGDLPFFEKAFFRNAVAIFFSYGVLLKNKIPLKCGKGNGLLICGRAVFGTIGIFCNYYAIDQLNISDASMLNKLSPFFAILFSCFLLQERAKGYQIGCVAAALFGTLFILKPGTENLLSFPALIGVCGGAGAGMAYTLLRKATSRGVAGPFIVFFFSVFSCLCCLPFCIFYYEPMNLKQLALLLLAGLSATGGQFSITAAYSHAPAREISVYDYSQVLFAGILGFVFLNELPDLFSYIGYAIIIGASIFMFLKNQKHAHAT